MRTVAGILIFTTGVALGFAWTRRPAPPEPAGPEAVLEILLEPRSEWDDGESASDAARTVEPGSETVGADRVRIALTLTAHPVDVAELIGADLAQGEPHTVRALIDALAGLPWERSAGVYRAVVLDPLLDLSLRVYGVEGLSRAGAAATPLLRDLLAHEEDGEIRAAIEQRLAAASGVGGTGIQ